MSARAVRGGPTSTRRPASRSTGTRKRGGKAKKQGLFDGLPISPRTARRLAGWTGIAALLIIALATAIIEAQQAEIDEMQAALDAG